MPRIPAPARRAAREALRRLRSLARHVRSEEHLTTVPRGAQMLLQAEWRRSQRAGEPALPLGDVEFRAFSQFGEDGILLYLLTLAGFGTRRVVELGCGEGVESNTANLILNHGCTGLLVDGNPVLAAAARRFYAQAADSHVWPPVVLDAFLTRESAPALLREHGVTGDIDVLSVDLDGMDFWVLDAVLASGAVSPRVIVCETNNLFGAGEAFAVPYDPGFVYGRGQANYFGASLQAFVNRLAPEYRLAGTQRYGFNAFFLRADVAPGLFPAADVGACLTHPQARHAREVRRPLIAGLPLVEVPAR